MNVVIFKMFLFADYIIVLPAGPFMTLKEFSFCSISVLVIPLKFSKLFIDYLLEQLKKIMTIETFYLCFVLYS
jgi:hypothetical protein